MQVVKMFLLNSETKAEGLELQKVLMVLEFILNSLFYMNIIYIIDKQHCKLSKF